MRKSIVSVVAKALLYVMVMCAAPALAFAPGETYIATAYSLRGRTASGTSVAYGIVAADPRVLRLGTKIHIDAPGSNLDGIYTVRDTGGAIKGKRIDIWLPSNRAAIKFGRQKVRVRRL